MDTTKLQHDREQKGRIDRSRSGRRAQSLKVFMFTFQNTCLLLGYCQVGRIAGSGQDHLSLSFTSRDPAFLHILTHDRPDGDEFGEIARVR